ncbi:lyase family protein, partial [Streptomyces sp. UNOC14_S4]|uniref:lyase family protein n=1 Tax=Streptomyces sp. UNOC14_S4 TaxID=2872340 RepID=UPI0023B1679B
PALPMGFGLKVAGWIDEVLRDVQRLGEMRGRVLVVQLFGGVGTMAGFGGRGAELIQVFARRLGLEVPRVGWHTARDRVAEYVCTLAMTAATLGRIADEVRTLSRPEFGELELSWRHGMVGSSTMPHKRNPEACEQVVALARLAAAEAAPALAAMAGDHERDGRTLRLEWACVPDVSHYTLAAAARLQHVIGGLTVHRDRLLANVRAVSDQVCTERLMLLLAARMGVQAAYTWVYDRSQDARSRGLSLKEELLREGTVLQHLSATRIEAVFEPSGYLGDSARLVEVVVDEARRWLAERTAWKPA